MGSAIPKTAPFPEEQIELLNRVMGTASAVQRAWLAGFLAGVDASEAAQPVPSAPARPSEPLTILYATESGNSEKLAGDAARAARKLGLKPNRVHTWFSVPGKDQRGSARPLTVGPDKGFLQPSCRQAWPARVKNGPAGVVARGLITYAPDGARQSIAVRSRSVPTAAVTGAP